MGSVEGLNDFPMAQQMQCGYVVSFSSVQKDSSTDLNIVFQKLEILDYDNIAVPPRRRGECTKEEQK